MASPHVAGLSALVAGALATNNPQSVRGWIEMRAEDLGTPGPDNTFGLGSIVPGQAPEKHCQNGLNMFSPAEPAGPAAGLVLVPWLAWRRRRKR